MITNRQNLISALAGERPDHIPYCVYDELFVTDDPAWDDLFARGLCLISRPAIVRAVETDIERVVTTGTWRGRTTERVTLITPLGEISQLTVDGWVQEYYLKRPADYRVLEYVVRHTRLEADYQAFYDSEKRVGQRGVSVVTTWPFRTPMQHIMVSYAGLEAFFIHLADGFLELFALQDAFMEKLITSCQILAASPARYVDLFENMSADLWGMKRFAQYHLPVYDKMVAILHAGGKRVFTHFDGKLSCVADLIARTEIDGLESLTMPPEGDMTFAQARAAWPQKVLWANINVSHYDLPPAALQELVRDLVHQAAPDGRNLALEISEDLPPNWRESVPVVLGALQKG